ASPPLPCHVRIGPERRTHRTAPRRLGAAPSGNARQVLLSVGAEDAPRVGRSEGYTPGYPSGRADIAETLRLVANLAENPAKCVRGSDPSSLCVRVPFDPRWSAPPD